MRHYGRKVKLDGYTFDSVKEASFYAAYIKNSGKEYAVHPQYELLPRLKKNGDVVKDYYDIKTSLDYSVNDLLGGTANG